MVVLITFGENLKVCINVSKYLAQVYISQKPRRYSNDKLMILGIQHLVCDKYLLHICTFSDWFHNARVLSHYNANEFHNVLRNTICCRIRTASLCYCNEDVEDAVETKYIGNS